MYSLNILVSLFSELKVTSLQENSGKVPLCIKYNWLSFKIEILKNEFNLTDEEIKLGYTTPANCGNFCAMLFSILNYFSYEEDVPYLNHWHHLINADFCDLRRGGTNYMSIYTEDSNLKENILYQKIRQIYTLECDTDPEFDDVVYTQK
ncbi:hypothetical protein GW796_08065 [archaeon]|nr:hypothetical protein [archaeon]